MKIVQLHSSPEIYIHFRRGQHNGWFDASTADQIEKLKSSLKENYYPFHVGHLRGFVGDSRECANEIFDMSNNPNRDEERSKFFGRMRSVSSGDIIQIDNRLIFCNSIGWAFLN